MKKLLFIIVLGLCLYLQFKTEYKVFNELYNGIIFIYNNIKDFIIRNNIL